MSNMIERVASVIRDHLGNLRASTLLPDVVENVARAAIAELREPTEEMASKGMHKLSELPEDASGIGLARGAAAIWRDMIDAALKTEDRP